MKKQKRINDLAWELIDLILVAPEDRQKENIEDLEEKLNEAIKRLK